MNYNNFYHKSERAIVEGVSDVLRYYKKFEWWIIGVLLITSTTLGFLAFIGQRDTWLDALYDSIRLFPMESFEVADKNYFYYIARWLSPFTLGLIAYTTFIFLAKEKIVTRRLKFYKDHTIICGLGKVGQQIANELLKVGKKIVIIESGDHNDYNSYFRDKNVIVLNENARDIKVLKKARIHHAKYLIAITNDDKQNIEIANNAISNDNTGQNLLTCYAHVNDNNIRHLFSNQNFLYPNLFLFNINEKAMRLMLKEFAPDVFKPITKSSDPSPKILIIGFSDIGMSLAIQLCITSYYINNKPSDLTIIHDESEQENADSFANKYSDLLKNYKLINIEFKKCKISDLNPEYFQSSEIYCNLDMVYLCIGEEVRQYDITSRIESFFIKKRTRMVLCLPRQYQLSSLLEKKYLYPQKHELIHLFKIVEDACSYDNIINEKINELAIKCHENYRKENQDCKDDWNSLNHFKKFSNFSQADHIDVKLRALEISTDNYKKESFMKKIEDPDTFNALGEMEHRRWMAVEIINQQKHKSIKPWKELTDGVKKIDYDHIKKIPDILE